MKAQSDAGCSSQPSSQVSVVNILTKKLFENNSRVQISGLVLIQVFAQYPYPYLDWVGGWGSGSPFLKFWLQQSNTAPWSLFTLGLWDTTDMQQGVEREGLVRTTLREFIIYLVFLGILCMGKIIVPEKNLWWIISHIYMPSKISIMCIKKITDL